MAKSLQARLDCVEERICAIEEAESDEAPASATFITQTSNASLTNEQALSALATGLMRVTTTTGVITSVTPVTNNVTSGGTPGVIDDFITNPADSVASGSDQIDLAGLNTSLSAINAVIVLIRNDIYQLAQKLT